MALSDDSREVIKYVKQLYDEHSEENARLIQISTKDLARNTPCTVSSQKIARIFLKFKRAGALGGFELSNQRHKQYTLPEGVWDGPIKKVYETIGEMLEQSF